MIYAKTERLVLRSLVSEDAVPLKELMGVWEVAKWMVMKPFPYEEEHACAFIAEMAALYEKGKPEFFALSQKKDGALVGGIGFHPMLDSDEKQGDFEIGYWLGKPFWAQGLMTEALDAVVAFLFEQVNTKRLIAYTNPVNQSSQNVLKKAGFAYQGIRPREKPGRLRGSAEVAVWELLRQDYLRKQ